MIAKYVNNIGGINVTDSPLTIKDNQSTGNSYNYDYSKTGAISKSLGHLKVNSSADTQLKSLGLHIHHDVSTNTKTIVRAAGTKLQTVDLATPLFTNQTEDAVTAGTDFLTSGSTQPVVGEPFNTATGGTQLWMAGGGMSAIYGYNGTKITKNGADPATGSIGLSLTAGGTGGTWSSTGVRYYAVVLRKRQTIANSNAALDVAVTVDDITKKVTVNLASVVVDTTKYDKFLIYRSAVAGVTSFTTGDLVTTIDTTTTSYTDDGSSSVSSVVVPRAGNTTDNAVLSTATYKYVTGFKRRLVTCVNSTVYLSDLNKPESWPSLNNIVIPTGGPITGLGIIGYNSPFTTGSDEVLVVFKENETWMITGDSLTDWELKYVDEVGCIGQSFIVNLNGFIAWLDYRGVYLWDGHGKPVYASRPIEALFANDGDLDKSKISYGWGCYVQRDNQVMWRVSHRTKGEQKLSIKLDTRVTLPQVSDEFDKRILDGVFILDTDLALYSGITYRNSTMGEDFVSGDDSGYVYKMYASSSNPGSTGIMFSYETKALDQNTPEVTKRYKRVIAVIERLTDNDLTLNYWSDYKIRTDQKSTVKANMAPKKIAAAALWDIGFWDQSDWDAYDPEIDYLEFNLHAFENNVEGTNIKLQFQQTESIAPVRLHGFYIEYDELTVISGAA